ncbi:MAG: 60S ribosomal export protein NMD3 [Vulcanisaeta sp. AZ3]|jgi:nonsense-mediated mRNA decay protein 3
MRRICALCGRETDILIEGLCPDCYRKTHPLARVKRDYVGIVKCPSCGAILYRGRWVRDSKAIEKLIIDSIDYSGKVSKVSIENLELRHGMNIATVRIRGTVHELINEYEEEVPVRVRYSEEFCPRCRDMINERERAVIQVRSVILIDAQLRELIIDIIRREIGKDKEHSGFVKVEDAQGGFDVKLSDQGLARTIAYKVHKTLPSKVVESQSVVRGRGDKVITKLNISVTIVPISRGFVITYLNNLYYVLNYSQSTVKLFNIRTREVVNVRLNDIIRNGITIPMYEVKCIDNNGIRGLEITIGNEKHIIDNAC